MGLGSQVTGKGLQHLAASSGHLILAIHSTTYQIRSG